jgi:hypothetical protein
MAPPIAYECRVRTEWHHELDQLSDRRLPFELPPRTAVGCTQLAVGGYGQRASVTGPGRNISCT